VEDVEDGGGFRAELAAPVRKKRARRETLMRIVAQTRAILAGADTRPPGIVQHAASSIAGEVELRLGPRRK